MRNKPDVRTDAALILRNHYHIDEEHLTRMPAEYSSLVELAAESYVTETSGLSEKMLQATVKLAHDVLKSKEKH